MKTSPQAHQQNLAVLSAPQDLRRIIHLRVSPEGGDSLMEMPGSIPVQLWMGDLRRALEQSSRTISPQASIHLETESGVRIEPGSTLVQAGINNGASLVLVSTEPAGGKDGPGVQNDVISGNAPDSQSGVPIFDNAGIPPLLRTAAALIHSAGLVFELDPTPVSIGRAGRDYRPEIDLSPLDRGAIASRRHANITKAESGYAIRPERATNGTFVNGEEIPAGKDRTLADGDCLQFGFHGVELTFRLSVK
jgi:hypothetical protein